MRTRVSACLPLLTILLPGRACLAQTRQDGPPSGRIQTTPLAFIRRLALPPAVLRTPPEAKPSALPPAANKRAVASWEAGVRARAVTAALRLSAPSLLDASIQRSLSRLAGLEVVSPGAVSAGDLFPSAIPQPLSPLRPAAASMPEVARLRSLAFASGADATLLLVIDRFATETGLERGVWLRCAAYVQPANDRPLIGPFYGVGVARSGRKLIGKGFSRTDDQLVAQACDQSSAQILHALITGEQAPFSRGETVAIVPAAVPGGIDKQPEEGAVVERSGQTTTAAAPAKKRETIWVALPSLIRQSDILFQPEIGPVPEVLDASTVAEQIQTLVKPGESLWGAGGELDTGMAARLAARLDANLLFFSRIQEIDLRESEVEVPDGKTARPGIQRRADVLVTGALYSAAERRVLWASSAEGGTIALTEYVRHKPRLRTDEQCVLDTARTAYAHLRYSFEEYRKRFERYQ